MKKTLAILFVFLSCQAVLAQNQKGLDRIDSKIAELDSQVNLTELQETQIRQIMLDSREKIMALQADSSTSREDIQEIRKEAREKVQATLTEEQKAKLPEPKKNGYHKGPHNMKHKMPGLSELKAERTTFDSLLSSDEKEVIENARKMIHANRNEMKTIDKDSLDGTDRQEMQNRKKEVFNTLDPIIDNHKEELLKIEQRHAERLKEKQVEIPEHKNHKKGKARAEDKFSYRFLIMKP